jgi:hypothetical protein
MRIPWDLTLNLYLENKVKNTYKLHKNIIEKWEQEPNRSFVYIIFEWTNESICQGVFKNMLCGGKDCKKCIMRFYDLEHDKLKETEITFYLADNMI